MAVTFVDLTFDPQTLVDADPSHKVVVTVRTNTDGAIFDSTGEKVFLGTYTQQLQGVETFTASLPVTNEATNPTAFQYAVSVWYMATTTKGTSERRTWDSGWFSLAAASSLNDIVEEQYVPPTWMTTATAALQTYVDEGEALLAQQESLAGIDDTDTAVAYAMEFGTESPAFLSATFAAVAGEGSSDDTTRLQALLTSARTAGGGLVRGKPGETYQISSALVIGSGTTLDMTGCAVVLKTASPGNMLTNYAAVTANRTVTDAAMTASSTTLTSATAAFTAADIGRSVNVPAAINATAPLTATITAVTNGTTVTLSKAALATVSGKTVSIYDRDHDITILGGTWDRQDNVGVGADGTTAHSIKLRRIDRIHVGRLHGESTAGKFFLNLGDVTQALVERITGVTASDLVHFNGPVTGAHVRDISGTNSDDTLTFIGNDWSSVNDTTGNLTDILAENIRSTTTTTIVGCIGGVGVTVSGVTIRGVRGSTPASAVRIGEATDNVNTTGGTYGTFLIEDVRAAVTGSSPQIGLTFPNAERVAIRECRYDQTGGQAGVSVAGTGTIKHLTIDGYYVSGATTNKSLLLISSGITKVDIVGVTYLDSAAGASSSLVTLTSNVDQMTIDRCQAQFSGSTTAPVLVYCNGGRPQWLHVTNTRQYAGQGILKNVAGTGGPTVVTVSNSHFQAVYNLMSLVGAGGSTMDVTLSGVTANTLGAAAFDLAGSMTLTVRGELKTLGTFNLITRSATQAVRVNGPTLPVDVSILTPTDGDLAYNTNAALGCGTGPAVYQTTAAKWKGLYSGATN